MKIGLKALKRTKIPLYWSKYSRKDYTIHQHIILIVLAQYAGSIERMLQIVREMKKVKEELKLHVALRNIRFVLKRGETPYIAIQEKARRGLRRRMLEKSRAAEWKKKYSQEGGYAPFLNSQSVFHSFKRVVGDYILSHSFSVASKPLLFKVLTYDLYV